jgi:hypothetical protein
MVRWRKQALAWLQADLKAWTRLLKKATPQTRACVQQTLQQWKKDPDLAGVRERAALRKLPAEERQAWTKLWAEVDVLLKRAQAKK